MGQASRRCCSTGIGSTATEIVPQYVVRELRPSRCLSPTGLTRNHKIGREGRRMPISSWARRLRRRFSGAFPHGLCRLLYLFGGVRYLQPPRSHRHIPGPTGSIGRDTRQDFKSGGRGKLSCEGIIEPVVFGSIRSLRPLKEERRASGLRWPRGTELLPTGGFEGTGGSYPRDQSSGSTTPPRRPIRRLAFLALPWAQRIDGVIGATTPMELTE